MNDPNLIFYIFAMMLGPSVIMMIIIAKISRSNRRLRASGFGGKKRTSPPVSFYGENFERDVQ